MLLPMVKDWDGRAYQQVSDPQFRWGMRVLDSITLRGDETAIDVGCGTGRLTTELLRRLPRGRVIAWDASPSMVATARERMLPEFGDRVEFVVGDALALALDAAVDLVFSTATFHWIPDHERLFAGIFRALRPGGRLLAQCGGGANLRQLRDRCRLSMGEPRWAGWFQGWEEPWLYASAEETAARLRAAGFHAIETSLEPAPTQFPDAAGYEEFTRTVVVRPYLAAIADESERQAFLQGIVRGALQQSPPLTLDYVRLNIRARRPPLAKR